MSTKDQVRWDKQHESNRGSAEPCSFLVEIFAAEAWAIPGGRALDIACGKGRNALFLAERGFDVVAVDISPVALEEGRRRAAEKNLTLAWHQADLEQMQLSEGAYDLVANFNYLQRSLIPQIKAALKLGGSVIFETYLIEQPAIGHPKNPAYLLEHNELLNFFRDFRVLYYREGQFSEREERAFRAGIFAQKVG
ncbi:MAG TPA: class I SAM-dependent methyltransferase [Candidatus Binatia bacterium]